jgi:crotonobetainyl-CoA:carnitine CoA-transferase CaiB-like acyl-CoA transferase
MTGPTDDGASWPLESWRVIDLSVGIAGAYCTKLLADAGADIVKVEDPSGDPLRRWSASGADIPADEAGALFQFLGCSKHSVVLDAAEVEDQRLLEAMLAESDAVVWSPGSDLAAHPDLAPAAMAERHPHLVVTAITPFGLDGPWADRPATDLTLQAWAGGVWARGGQHRPPVKVGGRQDQWAVGIAATAATLTARATALQDGYGQLVDVSTLEALSQWLFGYAPVTHLDVGGQALRRVRSVHIPGVEVAKDGWVGLMVGTAQQWFDFCAMVEHPEWAEDESLLLLTTRSDQGGRICPEITEWTSVRTIDEIRDLASAFLIPNAPIANGETITGYDHFVERQSFVPNPGGGFAQPDIPYELAGVPMRPFSPAPRLGEHTAEHRARLSAAPTSVRGPAVNSGSVAQLPLAGVRVLDLTSLFAGPFFTRLLAMFGAQVIHLESVTRPDLYRMYSTKQVGQDEAWCEWTPGFSSCNTNKQDLTLNLQTPQGRDLLLRLVATCDVVVENYSARVMENLQLGYEQLREVRPDLVMVRMPGFGLDGPWRDIPAFAPIIEDASGVTWLTGYPDEKPQEAQSVCDPNAAYHAYVATLLALEHRRRTGDGTLVEASMIGAALNLTAEQIVEHGAYGALLQRDGNRGPDAAPQGLYLSGDIDEFGRQDVWVAVAAATDEQWVALRVALGEPPELADADYDCFDGRRRGADAIDAVLGAWCDGRSAASIVDELWSAGVPVAKVVAPHCQGDVEQLQARGFFETVDHPVMGPARYDTFPARFSGSTVAFNRTAGPTLGQHNDELLAGLGCTTEELDELARAGVIGTAPLMGWRTKA